MREQMTSFDIRRMVGELQRFVGARTKKSYQPHHEQIVLRLNPREGVARDLVIVRGQRLYLSGRDRPMPHQPSSFAMLLRKHLANARIDEISQVGFDRIISFVFDAKQGRRELVVECFRNGNLILLDDDGVIIRPLTHAKYQHRVIKTGVEYQAPISGADPATLGAGELTEMLAGSEKTLSKELAVSANLGGAQANSLCEMAGLDGEASASEAGADSEAVESLSASLAALMEELVSVKAGAYLICETDSVDQLRAELEACAGQAQRDALFAEHAIEVSAVLPLNNERHLCVPFETLSEAIDAWKGDHDSAATERRMQEKVRAETPRAGETEAFRLERRLAGQQKALEGFDVGISAAQQMGKVIQSQALHIDELLASFAAALEEHGWEQLSVRSVDIEWMKALDAKQKRLEVELLDGGGRVWLELGLSAQQNAQTHFAQAKRLKDKSVGASEAVIITKNLLERAEKEKAVREATGHVTSIKRARRFWFERHRWTVVDGMHLFVGGRDAKGNDTLVKKHLRNEDLYFHADLHGAASCALKLKVGLEPDPHPPPHLPEGVTSYRICDALEIGEFSDEALTQSANMALIWSRGWTGGGGAGTAFWVRPGQVSKQAETGEFVAKGAFIVRGARNWVKDLEMVMGIGLVCINGVPLLLGGTLENVSHLCQRWAEVRPSRKRKEDAANLISKATGLLTDDILPVLPGACEIAIDHGLLE